jgi:hypothetical protein
MRRSNSSSIRSLLKYGDALSSIGIAFGDRHQDAKPPHPDWLLRTRRTRPCSRRTAKKRDKISPLHSITSSASARMLAGTYRHGYLRYGMINLGNCHAEAQRATAKFKIY